MIDAQKSILGMIAVIIIILAILQSTPTIITASATNQFNSSGTNNPAGNLANGSSLTQLVAGFVQVGFILGALAVGFLFAKKSILEDTQ